MKIKLWLSIALCFKLLSFSLLAEPLNLNQKPLVLLAQAGKLTQNKRQGVRQPRKSNFKPKPRRSVKPAQTSNNKIKSNKKRSIKKTSRTNFDNFELDRNKKSLKQATGIIVSFKKWPSEKIQARLSQQLKTEGLTLTKKFKSFKALVFSWTKLKTQKKAESVCLKLSNFKNLNYCEPDALLHPNNKAAQKESETEAGASSCTVDCDQKENSLSLIQDALKATAPETCELLSSKHQLKDGKLSDYWAQEMIGADLLREEIEKAPPLPEDKFLVAVFDSTEVDHSTYVQNLISDEGEQAVLPNLNNSQLQFFQTGGSSQYMSAVENITEGLNTEQSSMNNSVQTVTEDLLSAQRIPSFINNSMNWKRSQTIYEAMSRIHPPAVLVKAAGNVYPKSLDPLDSKFSKDFDSILVGSLSPIGFVSDFSQQGEEVHILAPSDDWITSAESDGSYAKFGGTSGAAPLVTGALAGFEWLSGYHPTAKEAKLLLEQTALPTINSEFENPRRNGVGMLNAYKLGMAAKRLKEKCGTHPDCFKREIRNPANYEFSINEENILKQVKKSFPECSGASATQTPVSCEDKKSAFKKLRQALLLDIKNVSLLEQLHCIYKQEGFLENALNAEATIAAVTKDENKVLQLSKGLTQYDDYEIRESAYKIAERIGGKLGLEILKGSEQDPYIMVRTGVARSAGNIGGTGALEILEGLAKDPDKWVRKAVARSAGNIGGTGALEILKGLAQDDDRRVRKAVAESAGNIGGTGALEILKGLAQDDDRRVRKAVAESAGKIGDTVALEILKGLAQDDDRRVREKAVHHIVKLQKSHKIGVSSLSE